MLLQSCSVMMCSSFGAGRLIAGSVALVVIAAGCSSGRGPEQQASPAPDPASMSAAPPASTAPTPEPGERSTPRWPIEHVVFLIKENRTFDNLFGTFPGANGVSFGYDRGVRRQLTQGTDGSIGREHRFRGHPALLHVLAGGVEPRKHGRVQSGRRLGPVGLYAASSGAASQLVALGVPVRARRQLLLLRAGTLVPEPPVLRSPRSPVAPTTTRGGPAGSARAIPSDATRRRGRRSGSWTRRVTRSRSSRASTSRPRAIC